MNSTNKPGESANPNNQKVLKEMQHYRQYAKTRTNIEKATQRANHFSNFNMNQTGRIYPHSGRQLPTMPHHPISFNPTSSAGTNMQNFGFRPGQQEGMKDLRIIDRTSKAQEKTPKKKPDQKDLDEMDRMVKMMEEQHAKMNAISKGYFDARMGVGQGYMGYGMGGMPHPMMGGYGMPQMGQMQPEYWHNMQQMGTSHGYSGHINKYSRGSMGNTQESIPEVNGEIFYI